MTIWETVITELGLDEDLAGFLPLLEFGREHLVKSDWKNWCYLPSQVVMSMMKDVYSDNKTRKQQEITNHYLLPGLAAWFASGQPMVEIDPQLWEAIKNTTAPYYPPAEVLLRFPFWSVAVSLPPVHRLPPDQPRQTTEPDQKIENDIFMIYTDVDNDENYPLFRVLPLRVNGSLFLDGTHFVVKLSDVFLPFNIIHRSHNDSRKPDRVRVLLHTFNFNIMMALCCNAFDKQQTGLVQAGWQPLVRLPLSDANNVCDICKDAEQVIHQDAEKGLTNATLTSRLPQRAFRSVARAPHLHHFYMTLTAEQRAQYDALKHLNQRRSGFHRAPFWKVVPGEKQTSPQLLWDTGEALESNKEFIEYNVRAIQLLSKYLGHVCPDIWAKIDAERTRRSLQSDRSGAIASDLLDADVVRSVFKAQYQSSLAAHPSTPTSHLWPIVHAVAAWQFSGKHIVHFHPAVLDALVHTAGTEQVPLSVLEKMPFYGVFIPLPRHLEVQGVFATLFRDSKAPESLFLSLNFFDGLQGFWSGVLSFEQRATKAASFEDSFSLVFSDSTLLPLSVLKTSNPSQFDRVKRLFTTSFSLVLYICAENAEMVKKGENAKDPKQRQQPQHRKPHAPVVVQPQVWEAGFRIGALLENKAASNASSGEVQGGSGRTVAPHIRRAHWHTFRCGIRRQDAVLRWLPPIAVNMNARVDADSPITVRRMGDSQNSPRKTNDQNSPLVV